MLTQLGIAPRQEAQVRQWVGNGVDNLIRRALVGDMDASRADADLFTRAKPLYKTAYAQHISVYSSLYPGVIAGLQALQAAAIPMACVTNKSIEFAIPLLERLGIGQYFNSVVGGECSAHPKPAPDSLLLCAERLGVDIRAGLMVGDSRNDVGAARAAGCAVICVPYGYNHGQDIRTAQPDAVIASIADLPALFT